MMNMKIDDILATKGKTKNKQKGKHILQKSTFNVESPQKKGKTPSK